MSDNTDREIIDLPTNFEVPDRSICVKIVTHIPTNPKLPKGFGFSIPTMRNTIMKFSHFHFCETDKTLSFISSETVPDSFEIPSFPPKLIGTTFADFCWKMSHGTTPESSIEILTKVDLNTMGDLTWHLPSKFADDLIDTMYVANGVVLEGILENAVLYGPIFKK